MASATQQASKNLITLKGSTQIVTEFFQFACNSILFQRGIYPPEHFKGIKKYGLQVMVTNDPNLEKYLKSVTEQMQEWIQKGQLQKMVLVVTSTATNNVLERWTFNVETDKCVVDGSKPLPEKSEKDINKEIASIIRQITASVTFLPLIDESCAFDLLMYTDLDADVPAEWDDSEERYLKNAADVALRSFSTRVHEVSAMVSYRQDEDSDCDDDGRAD